MKLHLLAFSGSGEHLNSLYQSHFQEIWTICILINYSIYKLVFFTWLWMHKGESANNLMKVSMEFLSGDYNGTNWTLFLFIQADEFTLIAYNIEATFIQCCMLLGHVKRSHCHEFHLLFFVSVSIFEKDILNMQSHNVSLMSSLWVFRKISKIAKFQVFYACSALHDTWEESKVFNMRMLIGYLMVSMTILTGSQPV